MQSKKKATNPVFQELAMKNVKQSARDYQIYFLTLTMAVALFYTFNSIQAQFSVLGVVDTKNYVSFSVGMMAGASLFICAIMGFLIMYANQFMLKRRKREMGIYMTLGMEPNDIGRMMWKETLIIGGFSLLSGLILGIILSQGLALVTAQIIGAGISQYHFVLSPKAMVFAVFFFGCIFLLIYWLNAREIGKMQLIDLIHADRKNEKTRGKKRRDGWICVIGLVVTAAGYLKIADGSAASYVSSMATGMVIVVVGTILFLLSFGRLLVDKCKKNKNFYYRRLNMFSVNQIGSRLKNAGLSTAVVCVLIYLSISTIAVGLGLGKSMLAGKDDIAPYDVSIYTRQGQEESPADISIKKVLREKGLDLQEYLKESAEIKIYGDQNLTESLFTEYGTVSGGKDGKTKDGSGDMSWFESMPVNIISVDDYNRTRKLYGKSPIELGSSEYAVNYNVSEEKKQLEYYIEHAKNSLNINGTLLTLASKGLHYGVYQDSNVFTDGGTLIVPQKVVAGLKLQWIGLNGMFQNDSSYSEFTSKYLRTPMDFVVETHVDIMSEVTSNHLIFTYIGIYLGITFLITAGAVLALQQLSQAADNGERYTLLRKLGTKERDMKKSLQSQMLVYFGMPFVVALLNSVFTIGGVYGNITDLTITTMMQTIGFAVGVVFVVYGIYLLVTYIGSRRILEL